MVKKIAVSIKDEYVEKLQKIRSNYTEGDTNEPFTFSGVINLILGYGFKRFEKRLGVKIDELETQQGIKEEDETSK